MVIAVSTRLLVKDEPGRHFNFVNEVLSRITISHRQHTFIFIFDKPYNPAFIFSENIIPVVTGPHAKTPVKQYIWYNIKIPPVLKKYKAEFFISLEGLCSSRIKIPQCLLLHDLDFLNPQFYIKKSHVLFYKKFTPGFIKNSKVVIALSEFIKAEIIKNYETNPDKIEVVYSGVNEKFLPVKMDEREIIKKKYAEGNEYFIYTGEIGTEKNLVNLLKAFSAFKKRQKSNMQLIIAGSRGKKYDQFFETLRLFKFKGEVKILENLQEEEFISVNASAYAMIYPCFSENFPTEVLQAMKSGVPVITSPHTSMSEICADAALYADPANFKSIAVQMMLVFKDENLRKQLVEKGIVQAKKYSWDITAERFWKVIEKQQHVNF